MAENHFPEKLLYYSNIDKYCIDIILNNTFVITDPIRGFNDPLDCFFEFDFSKWQKEKIIDHLRGVFIVENYNIGEEQDLDNLSGKDRNKIDKYRVELTRCNEVILKKILLNMQQKKFEIF